MKTKNGVWIGFGMLVLVSGLTSTPAAAIESISKYETATASCGVECEVTVWLQVDATCGLSSGKVWCSLDYEVGGGTQALAGSNDYFAKVEVFEDFNFLFDATRTCSATGSPVTGASGCRTGGAEVANYNVLGAPGYCWTFYTYSDGGWLVFSATPSTPRIEVCVDQNGHPTFR